MGPSVDQVGSHRSLEDSSVFTDFTGGPVPCKKFRSKWARPSATPEQVRAMVAALPIHISSRIWVSQKTGCWLWAGADSGSGRGGEYGRVSYEGKTTAVHILMYERLFGKIKGKRKFLDHECRTRNCCNPEHLEPVTHLMNCRRRDTAIRRTRRGIRCDAADIAEISGPCYTHGAVIGKGSGPALMM